MISFEREVSILESKKLKGSLVNRAEKIISLCKGKTVLHLGCADYPFSREQYEAGNLLHQKITDVAKYAVGVDISAEGIAFLSSLGYKNLLVGDAEKLEGLNINQQFDVVVAGEILEHLSNPGMFFSGIKFFLKNNGILILSVPNAHAVKSFIRILLLRKELIHPDHVYYFSQATIDHFCNRYGLKIREVFYYLTKSKNIVKRLVFLPFFYFIKYLCSCIGDGLIFVVEKEWL